ncbi:MAG: outer membrane lipoprotein-sorting protein [Candidatus Aminicenantes bacterium]|nr:MAG: outer membrane lipoprotein-sorting protein [Candidatus Aminicenantes bacterium]
MKKRVIIISFFILVVFLFPIYSQRTDSDSTDQAELETILKKCAEYCEKLANVVLFFVCQEEIKEEIFILPDMGRIERNVYVYDYQLICKKNEIDERRILLQENGQKKHEKDAQLKTMIFTYKNIIFGPIDLLSEDRQQYNDYRIVKEEKLKGEKSIVIEAVPKPFFKSDYLFGKIWVRKNDFNILKIEWKQQSIKNYKIIEETARKIGAEPQITLISEYGFEKNGIGFPSKLFIKEAYSSPRIRRFIRCKYTVIYDRYKFFTVKTESKIKREISSIGD